jgi:DNA methylase.
MVKNKKLSFVLDESPYYRMSKIDISNYVQEFWDVNETISELSYLTHSYFRYYGKFPSKIGKLIIEDLEVRKCINVKRDFILDNYAGSGTTLVEAKIRNFDSFGVDINPFAILACKVKTRNYDILSLRNYWYNLYTKIIVYNQWLLPSEEQLLIFTDTSEEMKNKILHEAKEFELTNKDAKKWFTEDTILGIAIIKCLLLEYDNNEEREFFELAFFAILRRVSTAYDGEVRPHVNQKKRIRNVADAYAKKVNEMIGLMEQWNTQTKKSILSGAKLCSNACGEKVTSYIKDLKERTGKDLGLVVSHPPYLNCFDYIPVYKLEFMWITKFDHLFDGYNYIQIKDMEIKSYPANSLENINRYFKQNEDVYKIIYKNLRRGGYCCIVIGDCTLQTNLFEVHKTFISLLEKIGFITDKISYRSTSYGIGQYAYRYRADYNENADRKKDGVLFFKKP